MVGEGVKRLNVLFGGMLADANKESVATGLKNLADTSGKFGSEGISNVTNNHSDSFGALNFESTGEAIGSVVHLAGNTKHTFASIGVDIATLVHDA